MPRIELDIGEAVEVTFKNCDGAITVAYSHHSLRALVGCNHEVAMQLPNGIVVHSDLPDSSGRAGVVYHEDTTPEADPDAGVDEEAVMRDERIEDAIDASRGPDD